VSGDERGVYLRRERDSLVTAAGVVRLAGDDAGDLPSCLADWLADDGWRTRTADTATACASGGRRAAGLVLASESQPPAECQAAKRYQQLTKCTAKNNINYAIMKNIFIEKYQDGRESAASAPLRSSGVTDAKHSSKPHSPVLLAGEDGDGALLAITADFALDGIWHGSSSASRSACLVTYGLWLALIHLLCQASRALSSGVSEPWPL